MKREESTEILWFIAGNYGLYMRSGCRTRKDAIADHVSAYKEGLSQFCWGRALSPEHKAEWEKRQQAGDYCVKATCTYPAKRRKGNR